MESLAADLVVIGAGPAGQKGAIQGAKAGKKVVLVDRMGLLGGACLHQGTIPSKALRRAILDLTGFLQSAYFGQEHRTVSMDDLTFRINKVIEDQNAVLQSQCEGNGWKWPMGRRALWTNTRSRCWTRTRTRPVGLPPALP